MSYIRLQVRRDTAANWSSANSILASGEHGYETDTGKFKIGDGTTAWSSLSYFITGGGGGGGGGTAWGAITGTLASQSDLQSALNLKLNASTLSAFGLTLVDDADAAAARATLGLVIGTNVQAQDAELSALAGLTSAADQLPYFTGVGAAALTTLSAYGRTLLDDANAAAARTTLGLSADGSSLVIAADFAAMRTLLGLVIGTNVQAYNANLTTWAGLAPSANAQSLVTAANFAAMRTLLGLVIGTDVQAFDADTLKSDVSANLTAGYSATQYGTYGTGGVVSSGTVTPAFANGAEHKYTNNGAHTLAPPTVTAGRATSITVEITNGASAGAITTSGFTKKIGDPFTTINGHKFKCFIHVGDAGSLLNVVAMQ